MAYYQIITYVLAQHGQGLTLSFVSPVIYENREEAVKALPGYIHAGTAVSILTLFPIAASSEPSSVQEPQEIAGKPGPVSVAPQEF